MVGSLAFPSILPYFVGQYIQAVNQDEADWGTDKMNSICLWLAIGGGTSLLCEWLQASMYLSRANWLGAQLRYDITYCFFKKYEKALQSNANEEVDELKSKKAFDFKNIELNIKVLQEAEAEVAPKKAKAALLVALSLALMIYTSWPLALMCLVLLLIISIVVLLGKLAYVKRQNSSQQLQE